MTGSERSPAIHELDPARLEPVAACLAAAFRDNPLNRAAIGGGIARRLRCNLEGMRALLPLALRHGAVWVAGGESGALIAAPPGAFPFPAPGLWVELRSLWVQGPRARARWAESFEHLRSRHPTTPHWYLATLGVAPEARGRGIGAALVSHLLERADRDAAPSYLETDRRDNVRFYERFGFETCEESQVLGTPIWHMRRGARSD